MYHMKTANVRELRNHFSKISKWLNAGQTVQIVKRGKAIARLVPEPSTRSFLGCMGGTGTVPADIDEPLGIEWEAMK
jgi:antitoxin (DNA-binding transcriptional repressor) of toxin-antitoxin stability system